MTASPFSPSRRGFLAGAAALGCVSALAYPAHAAAPLLGTQNPAWYRFRVGEFEGTVVSDGPIPLGEPGGIFTNAPPDELRGLLTDALRPADALTAQLNALVLNTGRSLVLFDTGLGSAKLFGPDTGRLLANLRAAGIEPAQVDAVVLTHAHPDHCWALIGDDGRPTFPNARVWVSAADLDFWTDEAKLSNPALKDFVAGTRRQLLPLRDRITMVEDGREVVPGVVALATPGHTVGHASYVVTSGRDSLVVAGDVVHHDVLSLRRPRLAFVYDTDADLAVRSRLRLLDMLAAQRLPCIAYHFPFPGIGHVAKAGEGYAWLPAPMLTAL